jgi:Asp-tRNA(Asn)/Glu-tRNA(Gln) amidotransferase A subunit family amidase
MKSVTVGVGTGIPFLHQLMDPLCRDLLELLLELLHHCGLDIFIPQESMALPLGVQMLGSQYSDRSVLFGA